jgi:hypothetical protein
MSTRSSSQQIADLTSLVERLTARLSEVENRPPQTTSGISNLENRLSQLESSIPANPSPIESNLTNLSVSHEKIKVALPDKFDGNCVQYDTFKSSLDNFFALKGSVYSQEEIKVRTIGTLLTKQALQWYSTLVKGNSPLLQNYRLFMDEFTKLFSDPNAKMKSQLLLKKLKQGSGSVLSYFTRFRALALNTGFDQEAQMDSFRTGLSEEIKDVLATSLQEISDLESLVSMAIKIDTRLYDRRMEKDVRSSQPVVSSVADPPPSINSTQIKGKLSKEERERRIKEKLCLYCGTSGHSVKECPKKKNKSEGKKVSFPSASAIAGDPPGSQH